MKKSLETGENSVVEKTMMKVLSGRSVDKCSSYGELGAEIIATGQSQADGNLRQ